MDCLRPLRIAVTAAQSTTGVMRRLYQVTHMPEYERLIFQLRHVTGTPELVTLCHKAAEVIRRLAGTQCTCKRATRNLTRWP